MRKPYLIAVVAMLAAVAGALAAVAVYLRRREQELDEYERLLFGEDDAVEAEPAAEDESATDAFDASAPVVDATSGRGIAVTAPGGFLDTPEFAAVEAEVAALEDAG